nr:unnamed protein product [Callosobruchus chinensis]
MHPSSRCQLFQLINLKVMLSSSRKVKMSRKKWTSPRPQYCRIWPPMIHTLKNMSDSILAEQLQMIHDRISGMKATLGKRIQKRDTVSSVDPKSALMKCVISEDALNRLAEEVNEQIKTCATVAMAEMSNVIGSSMSDAQAFMTLPKVIGSDVQRCGLSNECRWDIAQHSILEALQVRFQINIL